MSSESRSKTILERVRNGEPLDHIPVIDVHTHLGASSEYYYIPRSTPAEVLACMDRYGIDHIVAFPITITTDPGVGNDLLYDAADEAQGRFLPLTLLHAAFPDDWRALLEHGVERGTRGIKLISQYQGVAENNIDWSPVFDFAREHRWPVLHHSWGSRERLERWATTYPELAFIIGHATTGYSDTVKDCANVYQCTCAAFVASAFSSIEAMVEAMPVNKILGGSDALDLDFGTHIGPIAYADIGEDAKERILGQNAAEMFERLGHAV
ncbi:MAG: amidohydrolase family protein [Lentisphaerae bacterium]|jgi:uncharacterized protein|nr:amidohydrolase family protein [Lentisphaerota bacterium]MBT4816606.1 amidohydrolase family protein [Lentisphaerota bacterium]MBT5610946.1 amidohydrolase family protein [Lentisphaerota bacterium]MBT7053642.1 amidohydrolase family protein [Lentisphaerota bacterium]MBT7842021.1 amidohydrolase family protein [Lentisphaerota bacterium]